MGRRERLKMRVLFTNNTLGMRAGTELYVRDVALRLRELGHEPAAFSTELGAVAEELRNSGIPVVNDLAQLPFRPEIIHGQHHLEAMTAMLCLPGVPTVYFCHGAVPWEELPPSTPRILRYVAVDQPCLERIVDECGIAADRAITLLNFVDLARFRPRSALPEKPRRALVFSNYARDGSALDSIREACSEADISLDVVGASAGNVTDAPERILPQYDLVFAKGRAALEALAVGCAVVVWHEDRCGPLVTGAAFDRLRALNFGFRAADRPVTTEYLSGQIAGYSADDAAAVRRRLRDQAGLHGAVDRIVELYENVVRESKRSPVDPAEELRAAGLYWQALLPMLKRAPRPGAQPGRPGRPETLVRKVGRRIRRLGRGTS